MSIEKELLEALRTMQAQNAEVNESFMRGVQLAHQIAMGAVERVVKLEGEVADLRRDLERKGR